MIEFFVPGHAAPGGSKKIVTNRSTGRAMLTDAGKNNKPWRQDVAIHAMQAMKEQHAEMIVDKPIMIQAYFYMKRPKSHYNSKGDLKPWAPSYCTSKPDDSKLFRAVQDAMTSIVYKDDALVGTHTVHKFYEYPGQGCGVQLIVKAMEILHPSKTFFSCAPIYK